MNSHVTLIAGPFGQPRRFLAVLLCVWSPLVAAAAEGYVYYAAGHPEYRTCGNLTAGLALLGGPDCKGPPGYEPPPPEVDAAFTWMFKRSGCGHFVVLSASLEDQYSRYIYQHLPRPHPASVQTLVFHAREAASDPFVLATIRRADALFIQGGDQWNYIRLWRDTPVVEAIRDVARRGAPLGGTSAGLAVLSEFVFSAQRGSVAAGEVMADPYHERVTLERDFLGLTDMGLAPYRHLRQTVTESHFRDRDRMGRMMTFLARLLQDGWATKPRGIAIDEMTAVLVEADGTATIVDNRPPADRGRAYFFRTSGRPQVCRASEPLTFEKVSAYSLRAGDADATFNLATWEGRGGTRETVSVDRGVVRKE